MMEMAQGMSQGQDTQVSSSGVTSQPAPATSSPAPAQEEKTFRQSDVNEIVKKAKYGAVEDYKRLQTEQPNYAQQKSNEAIEYNRSHQPPSAVASEHEIRRMAAEESQKLRDQWINEARTQSEAEQAKKTVQNFWSKIAPGKEKYSDFEAVTGDIEFSRFPNVVQLLAEHVDNSHDMLYELGKDRGKMAVLEQLAYMSPKDAISQAKRMSQSLKDNESAGKIRTPNEPLTQMRPSNTGTDNGVMSVKDFRAKYRA